MPFCIPLIAISLLSFSADRSPFAFAFRWCSRHGSFVSGCKITSPRLLTQKLLYLFFKKKLFAWRHVLLLDILIVQCQHDLELIRLSCQHFVRVFQIFCPAARLRFTMELRYISYRSLGHHLHVKLHGFVSTRHLEVVADHTRDPSASEEYVLLLSLVLLFLFDVRLHYNFIQWLAPRVSKFGLCRPKNDRDVVRSSTEIAYSRENTLLLLHVALLLLLRRV